MKTIIEMAREANAMHNIIEEWVTFDYTELERFAELVRADERAIAAVKLEQRVKEAYQDGHSAGVKAEREACAKVCEAFGEMGLGVNSAAAAIRARGNT